MIVFASMHDFQYHRGKVYTTMIWNNGYTRNLPKIACVTPTGELVAAYRYQGLSREEYTKRYRELLKRREPQVKKWIESLNNDEDITILCACRQGNFCHRRLLASWLKQWRPDLTIELH